MKPKGTPPPMKAVRSRQVYLYAPLGNHYSFATVARAWIAALKDRHDVIPIDIYAADEFGPPEDSKTLGIAFGPFPLCEKVLKAHKRRIYQIVPDTSRVPKEWIELGNKCDAVVTPSAFGKDVLLESGLKKSKVAIVQHGVDVEVFRRYGESVAPSVPKTGFLHPTTSTTFWDRKGTPMLLEAWKAVLAESAWFPKPPHLTVLLPPRTRLPVSVDDLANVNVEAAPSRPPDRWAQYLSTFEAVICPSRGEGFGLIPIEARLLGVVPILTSCTGHNEHFDPETDVQVDHGPPTPCWGPGQAPKVAVFSIEEAILSYLRNGDDKRKALARKHRELAERWDWSTVLKPLTNLVGELA